jgi:hypothetical protein
MGLGNSNNGGGTFLGMFQGKFTKKADAKTPGAIQRTNKNGVVVYELTYSELTGIITGIVKEQSKNEKIGLQWKISITDEEGTYIFNIPYSGGSSFRFFTKLATIAAKKDDSLSRPLTIGLGWNKERERVEFYLKQDSENIKAFWTKDNPGKLPQLKRVMIKGKEEWDDTDQMNYIEQSFIAKIAPKLKNLGFGDGPKDDADEPFASETNIFAKKLKESEDQKKIQEEAERQRKLMEDSDQLPF